MKFAKVMFLQVSVCPRGVYPSMHWLGGCLPRGMFTWGCLSRGMSAQGDVCPGGCLPRGVSAQGVSGQGGVYPGGVYPEGVCPGVSAQGSGCLGGSRPPGPEADIPRSRGRHPGTRGWQPPIQIPWDTVNKWAVRILLEWILVYWMRLSVLLYMYHYNIRYKYDLKFQKMAYSKDC